ncbi:MAG: hypothetical protein R6X25_00490 [Candidatus Krumholzibacteriia bacterium]
MTSRRLISALIALGLATGMVALGGCDNHDGNEWQRLVCEVAAINDGTPLVSAYLNVGNDGMAGTDDDFLPIDFATVTFFARPYNSMVYLPDDGPYSWFHVTNYDLIWHPGPGAPAALTDYNVSGGMCDVIVPVGQEASVSILVADRGMKEESWYRDILYVGEGAYTATCELRFRGHETGSDTIVELGGGFTVTFFGQVSSRN